MAEASDLAWPSLLGGAVWRRADLPPNSRFTRFRWMSI